MERSRSKNAKRNIVSGIISCILNLAAGFFVRTAVIHVFNEQYLGLASVMSSVISVLNAAELGFSTAIVVSMYKPLAEGNDDSVCSLLAYYKKVYQTIGTVILVCGCLVLPLLPGLARGTQIGSINIYLLYLLYLADAVSSYFLFSYKTALLTAVQRYDIVKKVYTAAVIGKASLQLFSVLYLKNFYAYAFASVISTVFNNILIHLISAQKYPQYFCQGILSESCKKEIKKQAGGLAVGKFSMIARNSFDNLILSAYLNLTKAAVYSNYYYIYNGLCSALWIITAAVQAGVADSIVTEDTEKNYRDLCRLEFIFGWLISWCSCCLFCMYQPFMRLWAGRHLILSTADMTLFCVYFYSVAINSIRNLYFDGNGLWWEGNRISIFEALSNLVLNLILGRLYGITGILVATIITILVFNYAGYTRLLFREYFKRSPKEFYFRRIWYTAVTVIICIAAYLICSQTGQEKEIGLIQRFIICSVVSNGGMLLFYYKDSLFAESCDFMKRVLYGKSRQQ